MAFTAKDVMALREKTGAGMMDCKKALTDADGDMEKAADILRERGIAKAAKKASRIAAEGLVYSKIEDGVGVLVEVNCESDFVANGPKFHDLIDVIATQILKVNPATVEELLSSKLYNDSSKDVETFVKEQIAVIGEKISVRRFMRRESAGYITSYVHLGGKLGVLLDVEAADINDEVKAVAHDVTLQIAFAKPAYLTSDQIPAEVIEHEKQVLKEQAMSEGKPEAIAEKMVLGRVKKYYEENCLLDQKFIKDEQKTIAQLLKGAGASIKFFAYYVMGEGLEKKNEDLAEEVAKQVDAMKK